MSDPAAPPPVHQQPNQELSWIDKTLKDTHIAVLIIFGLCCGLGAIILGIIGLSSCQDPVAKSNAKTLLIIGVVMLVVGIVLQVVAAGATAASGM